jgi:fatty acyl-CoA reductase
MTGDGGYKSEVPDRGTSSAAAFFDLDGTLVKSTIVHYYMFFRQQRMSPTWRRIWTNLFWMKCVVYLIMDQVDRSRLNVIFYRNYRGLRADETRAQARACCEQVLMPRLYREARKAVEAQRAAGRRLVLLTGSLDFVVAPFAEALGFDEVIAARLAEAAGRFTGGLEGSPIGDDVKADRARAWADAHGASLADCHAFGDSIADLPLLAAVGHPHAINPDRRLTAIAQARGWPIERWTEPGDAVEVG